MEQEANVLLFPQIIKTVFQFLSAKEIQSIARVCKLWLKEAKIVQRQRRQIHWHFIKGEKGIGLRQACKSVSDKFCDYMKELDIVPQRVILFMTESLYNLEEKYARQEKETTAQKLLKILHPECQVLISVTSGIIGTTRDMKTEEKESSVGLSVLCLGDVFGIDIVPVTTSDSPISYLPQCMVDAYSTNEGLDLIDRIYTNFNDTSRPELSNVKAVMWMTPVSIWSDMKQQQHLDTFRRPCLFGGFVEKIFTTRPPPYLESDNIHKYKRPLPACLISHHHRRRRQAELEKSQYPGTYLGSVRDQPLSQFVMFEGADIQVASVRLDKKVRKEADVEAAILRLKDKTRDFPMQHSLAFMIACVARGKNVYHKPNIESSVFRRHFPHTPLLGYFANGEIGIEYPHDPKLGQKVTFMNGYTTFLTVISLPSGR